MDIDINKCTINAAIVAFESQVDNLKISLLDKMTDTDMKKMLILPPIPMQLSVDP